jgi:hypothetical protein
VTGVQTCALPISLHTTIYCGLRQKIAFFGSIALYIVVLGINSTPRDAIRPQYIVVGNVDKRFSDYIIIATQNAEIGALRPSTYPKKIFFFHTITFFAGQEEFHYEKPY